MKRPDIQGLRTLAIISVIIYHIWPLTFPNGFLGVDVFFVISGFLMAKCLANIASDLRMVKLRDKILHFYTRRIHRIVPVYLALITGTASIARTLMLDSDFQKARMDMYWALGFATNVEGMFESEDYFAEVFAYRPFLHTWSLGVEMQFYALAPFLMLLMLSIGRHQRFWRFLCCGILLIASVSAQQFIGARWDRPVAFGLVFCRIWQFAAGIFVFFLVDAEEKIEQQQERGMKGGSGGGANIHWPFVLAHQPTAAITKTKTTATAIADSSSSRPAPPPPPPPFYSTSGSTSNGIPLPSATSSIIHQQHQPIGVNSASSIILSSSSSSSSSSTSSASSSSLTISNFKWRLFAGQQLCSHFLLLLLSVILMAPLALPAPLQSFLGTLVVLLSALLLFVHRNQAKWASPLVLTNVAAVRLGDLSYVWYLVHWPTILFIKYFFTIDSFSWKTGIGAFLLTLLLAFVVDILLDAHFRKLPNFCAVIFVIGLFYTFCFFLILPTYYSGQIERIATSKDNDASLGERTVTVDVNFTKLIIDEIVSRPESHARLGGTLSVYEKIRMNELIQSATFDDRYRLLAGEMDTDKWGPKLEAMIPEERNFLKTVNERAIRGEGNWTFLLVGNSHADVISRELQAEYRQNYSQFQMFTVAGCVPFFVPEHLSFVTPDQPLPFKSCTSYAKLVRQAVEAIKPDVLFLGFRWYGSFQTIPFKEEEQQAGDKDELLSLWHNFLHSVMPHVGQRIFFPAPNLMFKYDTAKELAKRLWQGSPLEELHLPYKDHLAQNHWSYQRLAKLDCPKCTVYDIATEFCNAETDRCQAYDERTQLALFFDNNHISYLGRQRLRPFLRSLLAAPTQTAMALAPASVLAEDGTGIEGELIGAAEELGTA